MTGSAHPRGQLGHGRGDPSATDLVDGEGSGSATELFDNEWCPRPTDGLQLDWLTSAQLEPVMDHPGAPWVPAPPRASHARSGGAPSSHSSAPQAPAARLPNCGWCPLAARPHRRCSTGGHRDSAGHAIDCRLTTTTTPPTPLLSRHNNPAEHLLSYLPKRRCPGLTSGPPSDPSIRDTITLAIRLPWRSTTTSAIRSRA